MVVDRLAGAADHPAYFELPGPHVIQCDPCGGSGFLVARPGGLVLPGYQEKIVL